VLVFKDADLLREMQADATGADDLLPDLPPAYR
jgi:hypothetical protein